MAAMGTCIYPYLVDPLRLGQVYGSGDLELERAVFSQCEWPPRRDELSEAAADHALDEIINGDELSTDRRYLYTLVLEQVCATLGTTATGTCDHDDVEIHTDDLVHTVNEVLRRLGVAELMPLEYEDHPFLPGLGATLGTPTIEVFSASECARVSRVLKARWQDLTRNERAVLFSTLRLLDRRRAHDALVLFSY
jgi:hypothetical protein